jgi:small subunit ribosomal protein S6
MEQYELTFLVRPDLKQTERTKIVRELEAAVKEAKGSVTEKENWGKKILAYEIADQREAYYHHLVFAGPASLPKELDDILKMKEEVIRQLIVKREGRLGASQSE